MPDARENSTQKILQDYDANLALFGDFKTSCERLVAELLRLEQIPVHSVHARVKERPKLHEKLEREGKSYRFLKDITDIVGVRVITHFEDEVDNIGKLIEREFIVDVDKSVDKRKLLDPDRFGYLSLHYICSLSPDRLKLSENRRFKDLVCEIQIRSILQHAWAEIEHDLGYKSGHGIPTPIRRRFSRLAGLLEVADEEFAAIRDDLSHYESKVQTEVTTAPEEVGIDNISLKAMFGQNQFIRETDTEFVQSAGATVDEDNEGLITFLSKGLLYVGITTVQRLLDSVNAHKNLLMFYSQRALRANSYKSLVRGVSILHLLWILLALEGGEERILSGLKALGVPYTEKNQQMAAEWAATVREFSKQSG